MKVTYAWKRHPDEESHNRFLTLQLSVQLIQLLKTAIRTFKKLNVCYILDTSKVFLVSFVVMYVQNVVLLLFMQFPVMSNFSLNLRLRVDRRK